MKNTTITLLILFITLSIPASAQSWKWGVRGGSPSDGSNSFKRETVMDMATDQNGNVYTVSVIEGSGSPTIGNIPLTTQLGKEILIASYNCNGTYRWHKVIGSNNDDRPLGLVTDTKGHVYVATFTIVAGVSGSDLHFDTDSVQPYNLGHKAVTLIQYDTSGIFQWLRQPPPDTVSSVANNPYPYDMTTDEEGNLYWAMLMPPGLVSGGNGWVVPAWDAYILKYNPQGTMVDHIKLDVDASGAAFNSIKITRTISGNFIFAGSFDKSRGTGQFKIGGQQINNTMFLAAFTPQGTNLWSRQNARLVPSGEIWGKPALDKAGNIYISGRYWVDDSMVGFKFSNPIQANIPNAPFILKVDTLGNLIWGLCAGAKDGMASNSSISSAQTQDLLTYVGSAGSVYWPNGSHIESIANGGYPVSLTKIIPSGNVLSLDSLKSSTIGDVYATSHAVDKKGNVYVGGNFQSTIQLGSQTITTRGGSTDLFLAKHGYDCNCTPPKANFTSNLTGGKTVQFAYTGPTNIDSLAWHFGDGTKQSQTSGYATPITHTYANGGRATACATIWNSCGSTSHCATYALALGIGTVGSALSVKVYPNPTSGILQVEAPNGTTGQVFNSLGQAVKTFRTSAFRETIDLSTLPAGMYLLQLSDDYGNRVTERVVRN